jgi:hypothetical protein
METIKIGDDKIYLKKSYDGYRVIYPIKNDDGSWNWKNLIFGGSIWNFLKILLIFLLLLFPFVF